MTELSPETRAWMAAAGTGDAPSGDDRVRIRRRLAVELGAAAFATTTLTVTAQAAAASGTAGVGAGATVGGVSKAAAATGLVTKLVVAAAVAGAVATTAVVVMHRAPTVAVPRTTAAQAPAPPVRSSEADIQEVQAPIVQPLAPERAKPGPVPSRAPTARRRAADGDVEPVATTSIAEELRLLGQAQTALREGRLEDALARADEHALRFPGGAMREERVAVTMLARCAQHTAPGPMLQAFLASAPESPLKRRVREACGGN